jgi:MinD-like ATPase involved in chromosome partitioning or flagellar assembly
MTITLTRRASKPPRIKSENFEPQVYAVWGPHGSPGKSTIALNLAYELSQTKRTLLVDLDLTAPAQALLLGLTEPTPSLTAVARLIRQGRLTSEELQRLSIQIKHKSSKLRLLPGLPAPSRWQEITEDTVIQLLRIAKLDFECIVLDLSSSLEENLTTAQSPTTRNGATRAALQQATQVITLIKNSKGSLQNYANQFVELQNLNKNRRLVINMAENDKLPSVIKQLTKETVSQKIPRDETSVTLAETQGLPLAITRRKSPARIAILNLTHRLLEC